MARGDGLVERERELGQLAAHLHDAREGSGRVVLIEGPAGIGKSRLLAETRAAAEGSGMLVVQARASELERDFAFGVVRQLFEAIAVDPELAPVAFEGAAAPARAVVGSFAEDDGGDASFAALHGLFWVALNLAGHRPLLVSVDDLHWADRPSLRFLAYLVRRLDGLPILVAATLRSGERGVDPTLIGELAHDPTEASVQPGPLSLPAVSALLTDVLGREPDEAFADACHRATGGNPLLLRQLVRALEAEGVTPDAAHAETVRQIGPRAVSRTLLLRLARLDPAAITVARAVAILGESADLRAVGALTELDEHGVAEALAALASVEILQPDEAVFVHPLVRDAVYQELPAGERALAHARAATVLDALGASDDAVAAQLLLAPRRGDAAVVARLRQAAQGARRRGATESAVAYGLRALEEPADAATRPQVLLELGLAEALTSGPAAREHLSEAIEGLTAPHERALAAAVLTRAVLFTHGPVEARAVALGHAASLPEELADDRRQLEAVAGVALMFGLDRAPLTALRRWREATPDELRGPGARMLAGLAAWEWTQQGGPTAEVSALALRALEGGELLAADNGLLNIAPIAALTLNDRDETLTAWDDALGDAHRRGSFYSIMAANLWRSFMLLHRGELQDAEALLEVARTDMVQWGNTGGMRYRSGFLAQTLVARGNLAEARTALALSGDARDDSDGNNFWVLGEVQLLLAEGRATEALERAREAQELFAALPSPLLAPWRSLQAEALARLGRAAEGVPLAEAEVTAARAVGAPSHLARALRVLGSVLGDDGLAVLEEAVAVAARAPDRHEQARTHAALGEALRRTRRVADSREPLRRALELADACGADGLREYVRAELHATGARPRTSALTGVDALTASERRVAGLAADGGTNRDIAQALFVTPKTVEVHLSNAYRKLGVRSRRELTDALA